MVLAGGGSGSTTVEQYSYQSICPSFIHLYYLVHLLSSQFSGYSLHKSVPNTLLIKLFFLVQIQKKKNREIEKSRENFLSLGGGRKIKNHFISDQVYVNCLSFCLSLSFCPPLYVYLSSFPY